MRAVGTLLMTSGNKFDSSGKLMSLHSGRSLYSTSSEEKRPDLSSCQKERLADVTNNVFDEIDDAVSQLRPRNISPDLCSPSVIDTPAMESCGERMHSSVKYKVGKKLSSQALGSFPQSGTMSSHKNAGKTKEQLNSAIGRPNSLKKGQISKAYVGQSRFNKKDLHKETSIVKPKLQTVIEAKKKQVEILASSDGSDLTPQLSGLQKEVLQKVMGMPASSKQKKVVNGVRTSKDRDSEQNRVSRVMRSQEELIFQNKQYAEQLQKQEELLKQKDSEVENYRRAGLMLKALCLNQSEELKTLKAALPETIKETLRLRVLCQKQEEELRETKSVIPSLQEQVAILTQQLNSLSQDIEQMSLDRKQFSSTTSTESCITNVTSEMNWKIAKENSSGSPSNYLDNSLLSKSRSPIRTGQKKVSGTKSLPKGDQLEGILHRLNTNAERELVSLEQRCAKAFEDLVFLSSHKPQSTVLLDRENPELPIAVNVCMICTTSVLHYFEFHRSLPEG